ncbi:MAG TPA: biotin/lipoyl-containing protein [Elusimicrobiales bacterium]|nr:biotin/lipoyl-containing protein [Elusimicrobiales bacterium]
MNKTKKNKDTSNSALSEIKGLYEFMKKNALNTLDYRQQGTHIRLMRKGPAQSMPIIAAGAQVSPQSPQAVTSQGQPLHNGETLKSPLMGIFYRGPSPSSPPFVREGESVKVGQVLCLIESMKVFNEVKADCSCSIEKVLVENGKPVKLGHPLFAIKKT